MIYRIVTGSREHWLTGTPGIDIPQAFAAFRAKLSPEPEQRRAQLLGVLAAVAPGEEPEADLLGQVFVGVATEYLGLTPREMAEVKLHAP